MLPVSNLEITTQFPGYTLTEIIYQGSRTLVYRGIENATNQAVILKVLAAEYPSFANLVQFRNQYSIVKDLAIAGITQPLGLVDYGKGYALVMPDEGKISLRQYLQQNTLELPDILRIAIQLADILSQLHHHRIIHKDIKPSNLLIDPASKEITLTDFSIASCLPKETQTLKHLQHLEGTLAYLAPEQTGRMNRGIDYRTDFYSFGVTLYELLTGQLPFETKDPLALIHCHMTQYPPTADEINPHIPTMVAAIATKLMGKNAEDRYQSAKGLQHDLEQCLDQWQTQGFIQPFTLGQQDFGDRFIIPEKLYGRDTEIQTLLAAFERVNQGNTELMLVAGFAGIGKTAVVNEIYKPVTEQQGYFVRGKFDQINQNTPLSAFVQALRDLVGQLLSESDNDLAQWKADILTAVGENGQLLIDVIPDLQQIIGAQPQPPQLDGLAARHRFDITFQKFIKVFTTSAHPLVIFLDDLQWADSASLQLMKLLANGEGRLLLLGAYRDNEVSASHGLMLTLEAIAAHTATIQTLTITALALEDITCWVSEALHSPKTKAQSLSQLLHHQAAGNPFFTTQLLKAFHQDGHITFNSELGYWTYDLDDLTHGAIANVVDFMVARLQKLPTKTQDVLQVAACIGNQFKLATLAEVTSCSKTELATQIWPALREGLLIPDGTNYRLFQVEAPELETIDGLAVTYRFSHDRVQQAAYQLMPAADRQKLHWQIGQQLQSSETTTTSEASIFEIVNHLNLGCPLTLTVDERQILVELNLAAAKKAKQSTAYDLAMSYGTQTLEILGDAAWDEQYTLTLDCANTVGEAAYLAGDFDRVSVITAITLEQTTQKLLDQIKAYETQICTAIATGEVSEAIAIGLDVLNKLGVIFPTEPTPADFMPGLQATQTELGSRDIASLIDLPRMTEPNILAAMKIIRAIAPVTYSAQPNLYPLLIFRQILLSLQYGNDLYSAGAYSAYGLLLSAVLNDWEKSTQFGQLATKLIEKFDDQYNASLVCLINHSFIFPCQTHLQDHVAPLLKSYYQALEVGNLEAASYCLFIHGLYDFLSGTELNILSRNLATHSQAVANLNQVPTLQKIDILRQWVLNLQGNPATPTAFQGEAFDEATMRPSVEATRDLSTFAYLYLGRMVLAYLLGDYEQAQVQREQFLHVSTAVVGLQIIPVFYFYDALCQLADISQLPKEQKDSRLNVVADNQQKLKSWAIAAPMNIQHKYDLLEAEKYHQQGEKAKAIDLYDQAIAGAKEQGYIQEEALGNELAAKFYLDWGKEKIAAVYMQEAYYAYGRWGAKTKIKDLEMHYGHLLSPILQSQQSSGNLFQTLTSLAPTKISSHSSVTETKSDRLNEALDFAAILKASQVLSSTIQLDDLLCEFTKIILQNSGSNFCALLLPDSNDDLYLRAIATDLEAQLWDQPLAKAENVPIELIRYVQNTQEVLMSDDQDISGLLIGEYLQTQKPKSLLCLPLLNQGKLVGIAYLENKVATGVFTQERILILNFLCTQAAIFIQNSLLYTELESSLQSARETSEALTESIALSKGQQRILAFIAQGFSLREILSETALYIESQSDHEAYCSFLFVKDNRLCNGVAPSLPQGYNDLIDGLPLGPKVGSCGTSAYFKASILLEYFVHSELIR